MLLQVGRHGTEGEAAPAVRRANAESRTGWALMVDTGFPGFFGHGGEVPEPRSLTRDPEGGRRAGR